MRFFYIVLTMCLMIALIGCKKTIIEEGEKESTEESAKDNNEENNDENIDETYSDFMSIAEAQKAENGEFIWLTGYIVGSCQRSMKNTDFTYPFSGSTELQSLDPQGISSLGFSKALCPLSSPHLSYSLRKDFYLFS